LFVSSQILHEKKKNHVSLVEPHYSLSKSIQGKKENKISLTQIFILHNLVGSFNENILTKKTGQDFRISFKKEIST
jgi:hypothetical protein